MKKAKGKFITIEGGDGSGKATQAKQLATYLKEEGHETYQISFPQYGKLSAKIVEMYLNGKVGSLGTAPELASLAYAIDRFEAAKPIRQKLKSGTIVIADRYVASNMAHQAASLDNFNRRIEFYELIKRIEYEFFKIPRPDINIVLSVPVQISQANVDKKDARGYTTEKRDIHEADANHLENAKRNYQELCRIYPKEFRLIECYANGRQLPIEEIHTKIIRLVNPIVLQESAQAKLF